MRASELFDAIEGRKNPRAEDLHGVFRFDVVDVGTWWVDVKDGVMRSHVGEPPRADCTVRASEPELLRILTGDANLLTAFIRGEVELAGDPVSIKRFHGVLPPPRAAEEARP